ncbi:MAG: hypothetical protein J6Y38_02350 [Bacteroidaceae bacterium]|nr:hypothetical protein [Bacteroidaceae bacterium]
MEQKLEKIVEPQMTTRTLLQVALHKMNLQYDFDEFQNFRVKYQGDIFRIIADDNRLYLNIQYMGWYSAPLDDIDNLSLLYKAVNECNKRDTNRMVYTHHKIENEILLHTLHDILWIPQIPDSEKYLQATLDGMLQSQHFFFRMIENLRREGYSTH